MNLLYVFFGLFVKNIIFRSMEAVFPRLAFRKNPAPAVANTFFYGIFEFMYMYINRESNS
jgi:hypothetical protein